MNESRSTNASMSMPMRVDIRTSLQSLRFLEAGMRRAIAARPMDFVKDSFSIFITDVQPGRWMDVSAYLTRIGIKHIELLYSAWYVCCNLVDLWYWTLH